MAEGGSRTEKQRYFPGTTNYQALADYLHTAALNAPAQHHIQGNPVPAKLCAKHNGIVRIFPGIVIKFMSCQQCRQIHAGRIFGLEMHNNHIIRRCCKDLAFVCVTVHLEGHCMHRIRQLQFPVIVRYPAFHTGKIQVNIAECLIRPLPLRSAGKGIDHKFLRRRNLSVNYVFPDFGQIL